jgi:hypothetical protein
MGFACMTYPTFLRPPKQASPRRETAFHFLGSCSLAVLRRQRDKSNEGG